MLAPTNSIMLSEIDELAEYIYARYQANADGRRFIVGVAGIPGSGKSTLAYPLTEAVNRVSGRTDLATCVGGDGWHLSQAQLREMEDPAHLFARRGAHFTFDGIGYARFVASLDEKDSCPFPLFSHREKDPADGGLVLPQNRIVIIEGLYVHLNMQPWRSAAARLDERIWVETARDEARERLVRRHLSEGVETLRENAIRRAEDSDLINGDFVIENSLTPTRVYGLHSSPSQLMPHIAVSDRIQWSASHATLIPA
ncbi:hypothetical protein BMF94_1216 [Rhodotorula taiwanensis]|uniref:Phosphoribulokinase/uridine kinase domain-containing protein n=1 Tax=Rhodotorula taiwanensis TaxID=741276 RepID=A0A2S5BFP6_9BASI|nr:hypothetical protein BMF94_1216 [Rhodotorula taiwanensis]